MVTKCVKKSKAEKGDSVKRADLLDRGTRKGLSELVSFEKKFGYREVSHGKGTFQRERQVFQEGAHHMCLRNSKENTVGPHRALQNE